MMSTNNIVGIYGLADPATNKIRYIGKSTNIQKRYKTHINEAKSGRRKYPVYQWMGKLLKQNKIPILTILEENPKDIDAAEVFWILKYKQVKAKLLNIASGGKAIPCSALSRQKAGKNGTASRLKNHSKNPMQARLWTLKHGLGNSLLFFQRNNLKDSEEKARRRMRNLAIKYPNICGEWVGV